MPLKSEALTTGLQYRFAMAQNDPQLSICPKAWKYTFDVSVITPATAQL